MSEKKRKVDGFPDGGGKQPRKDQPSAEKQAEPAAMASDGAAALAPDGSPASGQAAPSPQHRSTIDCKASGVTRKPLERAGPHSP